MRSAIFTTATGTPLTDDEQLHDDGLAAEMEDQARHGIDGLLVAGSMGAMQLLTDETYRRLVKRSVELWAGEGELLIGAGDAGFARTRDRLNFLNDFKIDGVAILAPYFWNFSQADLIGYFRSLADVSKAPVYLYDLPQIVGTKLSMETILELAQHPNIAGAKMSCEVNFTRQLIDRVGGSFRIIVAQVTLVDMLLRHGIVEHLDGIWAIAPGWTVALGEAAGSGDWVGAADYQQRLIGVKNLVEKYGLSAFTNVMNARGIPGCFAPRPFPGLTGAQRESLAEEPIFKRLIAEDPALVD